MENWRQWLNEVFWLVSYISSKPQTELWHQTFTKTNELLMKHQYMPLLPWPPGFFAQDQSRQRPQIQSWAISHRHLWCWFSVPQRFRRLKKEINKRFTTFQDVGDVQWWLAMEKTYSWRSLWARFHQCRVEGCRQRAGWCPGNGWSACPPRRRTPSHLCHLPMKTAARKLRSTDIS